MKEYTINFLNDREPLVIKGATLGAAIEDYLRISWDLRYANLKDAYLCNVNLRNADLTGANLQGAVLCYAGLRYATLRGANLAAADLTSADLTYTDLCWANLTNAKLTHADLISAYLNGVDLQGANVDYSCLPFSCNSFNIKIDKRIACQLIYHALRAIQSVDDDEIKAILNDDKVLALANQFHRTAECGKIKKEQPNDQKRILSEREKLIDSLLFHVYDCRCQGIETETLKQWIAQIEQAL